VPNTLRLAIVLLGITLVIASLTGCDRSEVSAPRDPGPPRIVVTIAPVAGLVSELVGESAEVTTLLPAGASPHGYEMSPDDVRALGRADLIVAVGLGLEPWLEQRLRTAPELAKRSVAFADIVGVEAHAHHDHHHDHQHDHIGPDPHLWLDPVLAGRFVRGIADDLPLGLADSASALVEPVAARIEETNAAWEMRLGPLEGKAIVTHHAAFGRPAERYGLMVAKVLRPVETNEPNPSELAEAVRAISENDARAIFIEPQFNGTAAERIAEAAGVELGRLDPLGSGDWFAMMDANLEELVRALGAPGVAEKP